MCPKDVNNDRHIHLLFTSDVTFYHMVVKTDLCTTVSL